MDLAGGLKRVGFGFSAFLTEIGSQRGYQPQGKGKDGELLRANGRRR